ncbi:acyl-CoA dehydrogenase [Brevibacterium spongiae]|uniref:Acyl-CoA dehydrogenase n=1 Tax=Brevibacterium spongiae TaxID=2909672 RepID=A0ABY5SW22_9MICO|nr:acyl-CoA dehydrogenase [Brevibacterium spongiae]UVI37353.1 acyl-CoA dehydrogenase [Brevibacterium spongiae]
MTDENTGNGAQQTITESVLSAKDIDFLLYDWLKVDELCSRQRFSDHSRDVFDSVLSASEELAKEQFAPHARKSDLNEPTFDGTAVSLIPEIKSALDQFAGIGLLSSTMDESVGGIQLPQTVAKACFAWFQAANIATASYPMLTMANANLLLEYGTEDQIQKYALPELDGRFFGTMCLSEPDVGSSLGDVTTKAVPDPDGGDGAYRIHGTKMWISGGDHELSENIVHLVLARAEGDRPGTKGLSLFLVPKHLVNDDGSLGERNDVVLSGLNHKMGWRGTTNTLLNFGEGAHTPAGAAGAVGWLVGERGQGLACMFHMMNEARIGVGAGAVALGYHAYLDALRYARDRRQGRPDGAKGSDSPQIPISGHADIRRMLMASKSYVEGGLGLVLYAARLLDESETAETQAERDRAALLLDVLTPIVKTWPSVWCLKANDHAIQVLGGAGYTRDHDVEQLYRDNRLNPIHEGTHGIQAKDLLGRKVVMSGGEGLKVLLEQMRSTLAEAAGTSEWNDEAAALSAAVDRIESVTAAVWSRGDPEVVLENAWTYLEAVGHTVLAWLWLQQGMAAEEVVRDRGHSSFLRGKIATARYFFTHELPLTGPWFDLVESRSTTFSDLDESWL